MSERKTTSIDISVGLVGLLLIGMVIAGFNSCIEENPVICFSKKTPTCEITNPQNGDRLWLCEDGIYRNITKKKWIELTIE